MAWSAAAPTILLLAACGGAKVTWHPSLVSHVPDSTPVRFALATGESRVPGRALDWQRGRPRLITPRGDTVVVPDGARLEARLKEKVSHSTAGGIIGYLLGIGVSYAACPPPKSHCGEQDPTPILFGGLGALIGSRIRTDQWVRLRRDTP